MRVAVDEKPLVAVRILEFGVSDPASWRPSVVKTWISAAVTGVSTASATILGAIPPLDGKVK